MPYSSHWSNRPESRHSIHAQSAIEALKYKWLESEKADRDLGDWAIRCWIRDHWNEFLRHRWVEHLLGVTHWSELDSDEFGLLTREFRESLILDEVLWRVRQGWENLGLLNWAIDERLPMDEVHEILEALDINDRRLECQLDQSQSQAC